LGYLLDNLYNIENIGVIGGTFNPFHSGHLILAELFVDDLKLDKCFFVPSFISPFKFNDINYSSMIPEHRIAMINLAIKNNPAFEIDTYEIIQGGISYTYLTISYFKEKFSNSNLFFFIGTDQAINFKKWKNWKYILENAQLCIGDRTNNNQKLKDFITESLTVFDKKPIWIKNPYIEISSSIIRHRVIESKSIKYLVPAEVEDYILNNNLYKIKN
jgi:nicotinate-nucleotide adenylyltransferase